jgi:hypothetical protein
MKREVTPANILAYLQGNLRYRIYYSQWFGFLMRRHIRRQIRFRINFMDKDCYDDGSCRICGCSTTALQMANKPCDGECYPEMMDKERWTKFSHGYKTRDEQGWWEWINPATVKLLKENGTVKMLNYVARDI